MQTRQRGDRRKRWGGRRAGAEGNATDPGAWRRRRSGGVGSVRGGEAGEVMESRGRVPCRRGLPPRGRFPGSTRPRQSQLVRAWLRAGIEGRSWLGRAAPSHRSEIWGISTGPRPSEESAGAALGSGPPSPAPPLRPPPAPSPRLVDLGARRAGHAAAAGVVAAAAVSRGGAATVPMDAAPPPTTGIPRRHGRAVQPRRGTARHAHHPRTTR